MTDKRESNITSRKSPFVCSSECTVLHDMHISSNGCCIQKETAPDSEYRTHFNHACVWHQISSAHVTRLTFRLPDDFSATFLLLTSTCCLSFLDQCKWSGFLDECHSFFVLFTTTCHLLVLYKCCKPLFPWRMPLFVRSRFLLISWWVSVDWWFLDE